MDKINILNKINDIEKAATNIDIDKAALEALNWAIKNVENFIDNSTKFFKIDLILGESSEFEELLKLQNLYKEIPDDADVKQVAQENGENIDEKMDFLQESMRCRSVLNEITSCIFNSIKNQKDKLQELFERMIFFYEMTGFYNGKPIIQTMQGNVDIIKFDYEAFTVEVQVNKSNIKADEFYNTDADNKKELIKSYVVPEGFTMWIEIVFRPLSKKMASLF